MLLIAGVLEATLSRARAVADVGIRLGPASWGTSRGSGTVRSTDRASTCLSTTKTHLASLMSKLGARNRVELAMWAYETKRVT